MRNSINEIREAAKNAAKQQLQETNYNRFDGGGVGAVSHPNSDIDDVDTNLSDLSDSSLSKLNNYVSQISKRSYANPVTPVEQLKAKLQTVGFVVEPIAPTRRGEYPTSGSTEYYRVKRFGGIEGIDMMGNKVSSDGITDILGYGLVLRVSFTIVNGEYRLSAAIVPEMEMNDDMDDGYDDSDDMETYYDDDDLDEMDDFKEMDEEVDLEEDYVVSYAKPTNGGDMSVYIRFPNKEYKTLGKNLAGAPMKSGIEPLRKVGENIIEYLVKASDMSEAIRKVKDAFSDKRIKVKMAIKEDFESLGLVEELEFIAEDKQSEYTKFFRAALKKFGVNSPEDFKSEAKKKEFFDYVDKNWSGEKEESVDDAFADELVEQVHNPNVYGYWISPEGKLHEVQRKGHEKFVKEVLAKTHGIRPDDDIMDRENRWRIPATRAGFVRVVTEPSRLTVQGFVFTSQAKRVIMSLAKQYSKEQKEIFVEILNKDAFFVGRGKPFSEFASNFNKLSRNASPNSIAESVKKKN